MAKANLISYDVFGRTDFGELLGMYNYYASDREKEMNDKVEFYSSLAKMIGVQVANGLGKILGNK